jgi:hypothetical protein
MNKLRFCLVYFSLLVLVLGAAAQVQNGQFTGTVADPSGAARTPGPSTASTPIPNGRMAPKGGITV